MKALTLWRPWPFAIFNLPEAVAKRVENRSWMPPGRLIGERIAIHAGRTWDDDGDLAIVSALMRVYMVPGAMPLAQSEGIIGTAVVCGVTQTEDLFGEALIAGSWPASDLVDTVMDWLIGPYGWLLDDVRACPKPIPCKGRQGLWDVPPELVGRLP